MDQKKDHNQDAAEITREAIQSQDKGLPPGLEESWEEWSKGIKNVDERGMTLLRAAFEAGADAATPRPQ